jgi:hypothetical protein
MAEQVLIPGLGWLDDEKTGEQFLVPGLGWMDDELAPVTPTDTWVPKITIL